jgi:tetratricopeptide (TPR) repeat protein
LVGWVFAQKANPNKAYNLYYEKKLEEAKEVIDQCFQDPKYAEKASTWLYKGNIYYYLATKEYAEKQQNDTYVIQYPAAPTEAFDAFRKAQDMKSTVEAFDMLSPAEGIANLYPLLLVEGVEYLIGGDMEKARNTLEKAVYGYELVPPKHPFKGEIYYYYAYSLEMLGSKEDAIKNYEKAVADQSENPSVYVRLIELLKESGQTAKIGQVLIAAKAKMPDNPNIYVAEIDYYWETDQEKADQLLKTLPVSVYANADALVNIANIYIKKEDFSKAEELLTKANRMNSDNFVVMYNLGYCKLKIYDQLNNKANNLILNDRAESDKLFSQASTYLNEAQTLFENTLRFTPDDLAILRQLREIYFKNKSPKFEEINQKIEQLEK